MTYDYSDFDEQPSMSKEQGERLYNRHQDAVRSRQAEFSAGHGDARPDLIQYAPAKSQWSDEELRTVEDDRDRSQRDWD